MSVTATIHLDRVEDGKRIDHRISIGTDYATPLQALRAAHHSIEERWSSIAPLIDAGETLRVEVEADR